MNETYGLALLIGVFVVLIIVGIWLRKVKPDDPTYMAVESFLKVVIGCIVGLAFAAAALFGVIWVIKRMWEAA